MRLIGKSRLKGVRGIADEIDVWISAWVAEVSNANWRDPSEVLSAYPRAKQFGRTLFAFPVCSSNHLVELHFYFEKGIALIKEVTTNE